MLNPAMQTVDDPSPVPWPCFGGENNGSNALLNGIKSLPVSLTTNGTWGSIAIPGCLVDSFVVKGVAGFNGDAAAKIRITRTTRFNILVSCPASMDSANLNQRCVSNAVFPDERRSIFSNCKTTLVRASLISASAAG